MGDYSLLTGNAAGADLIVDLAGTATMDVYRTSSENATCYGDNIHPTSVGYAMLAPI